MIYQFNKDTYILWSPRAKILHPKKCYEMYRASHAVTTEPLFAAFKKRLHNSNSANSNIIITTGVVAFCYRSFDNDCCYNGGYFRFEKRAFSIIRGNQSHVCLRCFKLFVCKLKMNCANLMHIQQVFCSNDKRVIFSQFQNVPLLCVE